MKLVMWIALVVACSKASEAPPVNVGPRNDGIEIVSLGTTTPRVLRYQLQKGTKSQIEISMGLDTDAGGRAVKLPALAMTLDVIVEDVLPDGSAKIKTRVTAAQPRKRPGSVDPSPMMATMTNELVGVSYTSTLAPNGRLRDTKLDASQLSQQMKDQLGQLTQNLEQLAMPLPDDPVGVGAKWSTKKSATQEGLELVTVTTIEVVAIEGSRVTFASTSTVSAKDQTLKTAGASLSVKDVGGAGTGKGTLDLTRMTMAGEFDLELRGTMSAQGETAPMKMTMTMTMTPLGATAPTQGAQSAP